MLKGHSICLIVSKEMMKELPSDLFESKKYGEFPKDFLREINESYDDFIA